MANDKDLLLSLAEPGVKDELRKMQTRLNVLHRLFPHIVANADGTVPSVLPIEYKSHAAAQVGRGKAQGPQVGAKPHGNQKVTPDAVVACLEASGGTSQLKDIADYLKVDPSGLRKRLRAMPEVRVYKEKGRIMVMLARYAGKAGKAALATRNQSPLNKRSISASRRQSAANMAAMIENYIASVPQRKATMGELALVVGVVKTRVAHVMKQYADRFVVVEGLGTKHSPRVYGLANSSASHSVSNVSL